MGGATLTTIETETVLTSYGIHNTPVPAFPDYIIAKRVRLTHAEVVKNTQFLYSAAGNVTTKKEFDGTLYPVTTKYKYDCFGNSTKATVTAGSSAGFRDGISITTSLYLDEIRGKTRIVDECMDMPKLYTILKVKTKNASQEIEIESS